jgi:hypothetical protein
MKWKSCLAASLVFFWLVGLSCATINAAASDLVNLERTQLNWQLEPNISNQIQHFSLIVDGEAVFGQILNQNQITKDYTLTIDGANHYFLSFYHQFNPGGHLWQLSGYDASENLVLQSPEQLMQVGGKLDWRGLAADIIAAFQRQAPMMLSVTLALGTIFFLVSFGLFFILDLIFSKGLTTIVKFRARDKLKLQKTGYIYDTKTSVGVPFALVTLEGRDKDDHNLVITSVSDVHGIYNAIVAPSGTYTLSVKKNGYFFPTRKTKPSVTSTDDFYKGEELIIARQRSIISPTIPVDPVATGKNETKARARFSDRFWQRWKNYAKKQVYFEILLLVLSLIGVVRDGNLIFVFSSIVYALFIFRRLLSILQPMNMTGQVIDENEHGLAHTVVEIYQNDEENFFKTMVITGKNGKFAFHLQPGTYAIKAHKNGYLGEAEGRAVNVDENFTIAKKRLTKTIKLVPIPHLMEDFFFKKEAAAKASPVPVDDAEPAPLAAPPPPQS